MPPIDTAELRRLWEAANSTDGCSAMEYETYHRAAHNALPALLDELEAAREINGRLYEAAEIAAHYLHGIRKAVPETIYADILGNWDVSHPALDQCAYYRSGTESALSEALDKASDVSAWLDARDRHTKLIGAAEELERLVDGIGSGLVMGDGEFFDGIEAERRQWQEDLRERAAQLRQEAEV